MRPAHTEGYKQAEWVLLDYVDFVVHVFSDKARKYYDLERLWKSAKKLEPAELKPAARRKRKLATTARASARSLRAFHTSMNSGGIRNLRGVRLTALSRRKSGKPNQRPWVAA